MSGAPTWVDEKAGRSLHPAQVNRTLAQLCERWPRGEADLRELIERFPLGEEALLHLVAVSSICAARLLADPQILEWLRHPDVCAAGRGAGRMLRDLEVAAGGTISAQNFRALRLWKGREMLRIALREVAEEASLEETTAELSHLAEICVARVLEHWEGELRRRLGSPDAQFAVLALGKLGGLELNHSSDIDVIFLYSNEGQTSPTLTNHEWFNRLATKVFETFAVKDPAGSLFRMDLRLRPEGTAGPMTRSLASMENYYAGFGETWERLALIKARGITGDGEVTYDFLRALQPFIYPRSASTELLDEIAAIKRRIERDIVGHEDLERNVKLGVGGIREIEFVVQALQLLHGARHAFLQETSTLKALPALAQLDLLPQDEALDLNKAYHFLRRVEHRLQIEAEQQTHTLPDDPETMERLARSLGFPTAKAFSSALQQRRERVREIFQRVISARPQDKPAAPETLEMFHDPARANKALEELAQGRSSFHIAPRTRQIFRKLRPMLLGWVAQVADPDATLTQFVRFVESYGLRSLLFELLVTNPMLLELLVKLFDASRAGADFLIRRPQLLEDVTRAGMLDRNVSVGRHLVALRKSGASAGKLDLLRGYRQAQLLRILLRDVLGLARLDDLHAEHSALAEACLLSLYHQFVPDGDLTIIALGKFGGCELSYGADLDVVFVGENTRAAQELMTEMGRTTAEGQLAPLDARLRPDGEKGPLTCSLEAYESYYWTRAQLWEIQALTRARVVHGAAGVAFIEMARKLTGVFGQRDDLFAQIDAMCERIRRDRGTGSGILDFKTGLGGIVEAEFLVQGLQLRAGLWNPNFAAALESLQVASVISAEHAARLQCSYDFLRRVESILRRVENKSISSLPADEAEHRKLAQRMGAKGLASFGDDYRDARETIHAIYIRYFE